MEATPRRARIQQGFLLLFGLAAFAVCFVIVRPFLLPAATALALAVLFHPMLRLLHKWGLGKTAAASLSVILVVLLILVPLVFLGLGAYRELKQLFVRLAQASSADGGWEPYLLHLLERPLSWIGISSTDPDFNLRQLLRDAAEAGAATLGSLARGLVTNIAGSVLDLVVVLFTLFFLLRDGERIRNRMKTLLPLDPEVIEVLFDRVHRAVVANLYGVVVVAAAQGGLTGLAFWFLSLPNPVLWSVVAGLLSMIPLVGASSVWVVAAIWLAVTGHYVKAAILTAFGAGVIGLADNVIRPYVVSGQVKMHPLLVFFALLGGTRAFGLTGLFIGPAVLSVALAILEMTSERPAVRAS
jgi:predicted PurR-regulated permease PerM